MTRRHRLAIALFLALGEVLLARGARRAIASGAARAEHDLARGAAMQNDPAPAAAGYVVRADSDVVYLDLGEAAGASVGRAFTIYTEGDALKHPVTGEILGRMENAIAHGRVEQVFPKYSVGRLVPAPPPSAVRPGQRARLDPKEPASASPPASSPPPAAPGTPAARAPAWRSPSVEMEAVDLALGDVSGRGAPDIILADAGRVNAYPESSDGAAWTPSCGFQEKSSARILSIEAADLDGDGKAEVFATVLDSFFNRAETWVLQCRNGEFKKAAVLPWMTRAFDDGTGELKLATQELLADSNFPLGAIYPLEYKDGKYVRSKSALRLARVDWAYGFAVVRTSEPFHMFYTGNNGLRLQFKKDSWSAPESFGQTPQRIFWYGKPLLFHPRILPSYSPEGFSGVYTVKNIAGLGGLSAAFGIFTGAELHHLKWNGLGLDPDWKTDLTGYAADLTVLRANPNAIYVAVVGRGGRTSVWKFLP